jgi:hypothetical protein
MARAKFRVTRIELSMGIIWDNEAQRYKPAELQTLVLIPVAGIGSENAEFFATIPSGEIELREVNAAVAKDFDLDQEFYVDFTPVP